MSVVDAGLVDKEHYGMPKSVKKQLKGKFNLGRLDLKNPVGT